MLDLLEDLFGDLIFKGLKHACRELDNYSSFRPRLAAFGRVFLLLVLGGGAVAWFGLRAYWAWKAGDTPEMWLYLFCAGALVLIYDFLGLRRFLRWRRIRRERMYDPRYQK